MSQRAWGNVRTFPLFLGLEILPFQAAAVLVAVTPITSIDPGRSGVLIPFWKKAVIPSGKGVVILTTADR
jgi:hypothetical protein